MKVKTTAEQQEQKRKEREKKLKLFQKASGAALEKIVKEQYDETGLDLTKQILAANSDYSSMWNYRKNTFNHITEAKTKDEVKQMLNEELEFVAGCLRNNPKSYGCWHQRCFVMLKMPNPDWGKELELCNRFLQFDDRNFHCWDYRRFIVRNSEPVVSVEDEIKFTDKLVQNNFSNYSSWHYRSKLMPLQYPNPASIDRIEEKKLLEELELVQNAFFTDPNDQSAWFYHRWLLGRGETSQVVIAVHVNLTAETVSCVFRKPLSAEAVRDLVSVKIDNELRTGIWSSPCDKKYQNVWSFAIDCALTGTTCSVIFEETPILVHEFSAECRDVVHICNAGEDFKQELSSAKLEVLQLELDSCMQLDELEPGNKWVMLTLILLMRAIDPAKYGNQVKKYLEELQSVDRMRKNYYRDLNSKFTLEDFISNVSNSQISGDLSCKGLSKIYHVQYFSSISYLDISSNCLKGLTEPFHSLLCCETLIADKNQIKDVSGLKHMPKLTLLSLAENCISQVGDISSLTSCPKLEKLNLEKNCVSDKDAESIRKSFQSLQITF